MPGWCGKPGVDGRTLNIHPLDVSTRGLPQNTIHITLREAMTGSRDLLPIPSLLPARARATLKQLSSFRSSDRLKYLINIDLKKIKCYFYDSTDKNMDNHFDLRIITVIESGFLWEAASKCDVLSTE